MVYQRPTGTQDVTPDGAVEWRHVEESFRQAADRYGYGELRTPMFEDTDLFLRSVGEETDIARKEMYTFKDRAGRSLTLRAEGTAPAVRAYLENNLWQQDHERLVKLYYIAPIFRYDRPQAGRYRQHHQCGLEAIGSINPAVDAEIISFCWRFLGQLGLANLKLLLNSVGCSVCTPRYVTKLRETMVESLGSLCEECQRRYDTNPLRMLDCKLCQDYLKRAPRLADELCEDCDEHFRGVQEALTALGVPFAVDHTIVRGLDYYTKTAFELRVEGIGAQAAVGGGGRYDGLVEQCGGRPTPGVGVGLGLERILLARKLSLAATPEENRSGVFIVALGDPAWTSGLQLLDELRTAGVKAEIDYRRRSLKSQLRFADSDKYAWAAILGEDEMSRGVVGLKNLETGQQEEVARAALVSRLR